MTPPTKKPVEGNGILAMVLCSLLLGCTSHAPLELDITPTPPDLHFDQLSNVWDEAIPLGNGMVGALIWEKDGKLRFSLDRADLWDLRPMENLKAPEWKYSWVYEQWKKGDYKPVQDRFDVPYDNSPAPSKIPGAAIEFDISSLGEVEFVHLYLDNAICEVKWKNGVKLLTFVHATEPVGWYRFEGLKEALPYDLIPPAYNSDGKTETESPVTGQDLRRLGYPEGKVSRSQNSVTYDQEGWGGFKYQVNITNGGDHEVIQGCWSISSEFPGWDEAPSAKEITINNLAIGIVGSFNFHRQWWDNFWSKSSLQVPDETLQKQWYLEQYKFGCAARTGAPPISLQAVWTADNGKLPPWKGDFHHDLNTQLSYWPAYSGNHLDQEIGFLDWLWEYKDTFEEYTRQYYQSEGLNVPGVTTLIGQPMGGWIQYAFGPTVSAWLGQHFYLHWRYSMDREFLDQRAYPWIKAVAVYLEGISELNDKGMRKLPISSSPEIYDNSRAAWFGKTTNFDLSLIRWTYEKAVELALELGLDNDAHKWKRMLSQWPDLAVDGQEGLMFAPDTPYNESHRHFSHQLAYHPLGLIDYSKGKPHQEIIKNTIITLEEIGTSGWVGYSFSWMGNLKARAFDGEGAAENLKIFAASFCLPNSFHVNGDQSGKGYSNYTYRPFTLEGNFAFAAGLQEMLIQSHTGIVHIFPAVPADWKNISFYQLRTEGAFLVSANKENGTVSKIEVESMMGGILKLKDPFNGKGFDCSTDFEINSERIITITTKQGNIIVLSAENE
jgi:alpha-L-fucosidase 2